MEKFYNISNKSKLIIVTSSEIDIIDGDGIEIRKNLSNEDITKIMLEATFSILPIKPNICYNNTTLKTATLFGTIPIGKFSDEIKQKNEKFYLEMNDYNEEDFFNILKDSKDIQKHDFENIQEKSILFGKQYNSEKVAKFIYGMYSKNIEEKK